MRFLGCDLLTRDMLTRVELTDAESNLLDELAQRYGEFNKFGCDFTAILTQVLADLDEGKREYAAPEYTQDAFLRSCIGREVELHHGITMHCWQGVLMGYDKFTVTLKVGNKTRALWYKGPGTSIACVED